MSESFYRALFRIRRVEEKIAEVYPTDRIQSPVHLSIGQEAVSVGVCAALRPEDVVFGTYRCHALYLAKGGSLRKMIAELYGKVTGCARGRAGSMHLIDVEAGVMGASAVVGTTIPLAVGFAMARQLQRLPTVVACFFGDGAVEEGVFHESLNFAALKQAPIVFVCENNGYAIHSPLSARQRNDGICALARAHGVEAELIETLDVFTIQEKVGSAVEEIRAGRSGPRFFECRCYRWCEHVGPRQDFHAGYRSQAEAEPWIAADEVRRVGARLDPTVRERIERDVDAEIAEAFAFAEHSPFPEEEELYADLYHEPRGYAWNAS